MAASSTTNTIGVSDEEALQALLASAQERQVNRTTDSSSNHARGHNSTTKRQRESSDQHRDNKNQRLAENHSYYGPRRGEGDRGRRGGDRDDNNHRDRGRTRNVEPSEERNEGKKNSDDNDNEEGSKKPPQAHKPNFGLSGALAKDVGNGGSMYKGVVLKFQEPPEARAPNTQWRFYVFKGKELLETLHISKQSAYLCGRNPEICDIAMAHPSLSSQHAVLQYRALPHKETGRLSCQPYIMDLESTNGTFLNGVRIDAARNYQLKKGDVLTFGASKREYVLLTENTTALR